MPDPGSRALEAFLLTAHYSTFEDFVAAVLRIRWAPLHVDPRGRRHRRDLGVDIAARKQEEERQPQRVVAVSTAKNWRRKAREDAHKLIRNLEHPPRQKLWFSEKPPMWCFVSSRDVQESNERGRTREDAAGKIRQILGSDTEVHVYGQRDLIDCILNDPNAYRTVLQRFDISLKPLAGPREWIGQLRLLAETDLRLVESELPTLGHLRRPVVSQLVDLAKQGAWHLIVGDQGVGKSNLLADAVRQLQREEIPVLYIAGREYGSDGVSLEGIQNRLALREPLLTALDEVRQYAGTCVVVLDQLEDAGGAAEPVAACTLLRDLHARSVSVLAACKAYEADEVRCVKRLQMNKIHVRPLDDEQTQRYLRQLGVSDPAQDVVVLASNLLDLSHFARLADADVDISNIARRAQLWDQHRMAFIGEHENDRALIVALKAARGAIEEGAWEIPVAGIGPALPRLISAGVLARASHDTLRFRHDQLAYFLYAWWAVRCPRRWLPQDVLERVAPWRALRVFEWMYALYRYYFGPAGAAGFVRSILAPESEVDFLAKEQCLEMVAREEPEVELAEAIVPALTRPALAAAFYRNLHNPGWLRPLFEAGEFGTFPEPEPDEKGGVSHYRWSAGAYLRRCTGTESDLVAEIILGAATENMFARHDLALAALDLPLGRLEDLVDIVAQWLRWPYWTGFAGTLGQMATRLAEGERWGAVDRIVAALFNIKEVKKDRYLGPKVELHVPLDDVERVLEEHLPSWLNAGPVEMVAILEITLLRMMSASDWNRGKRCDWSYVWCEDVSGESPHASGDPVRVLVPALTRAVLQAAKQRPQDTERALRRYLAGHKLPYVLTRIALYVLSEHPEAFPDGVSDAYGRARYLDDVALETRPESRQSNGLYGS